jgi:hypothetical protein
MEPKYVIIETFENAFEAEVARGHLEAAGIAAAIEKDDVGNMIPSLQASAGVRLIVREEQAEQARKMLLERRKFPLGPDKTK